MLKTTLKLLKSYKSFQHYCIFTPITKDLQRLHNYFSTILMQIYKKLSICIYAKTAVEKYSTAVLKS